MEVKNLDALKKVVADAGCEWLEGKKTYAWYGRFLDDWNSEDAARNRRDPAKFGKCDHAIRVPGTTYEIGVRETDNGSGYELDYDQYGPGQIINAKFGGNGCPRLKQVYSAEVTRRQLARKGYRVTTVTDVLTGEIKIKAVK